MSAAYDAVENMIAASADNTSFFISKPLLTLCDLFPSRRWVDSKALSANSAK